MCAGVGGGRRDVAEVQAGSGPTVRRMLVGAQLRRLRTENGLSREQAGEAIRASEWKIHRLENGQVGFKDRDIVDLQAAATLIRTYEGQLIPGLLQTERYMRAVMRGARLPEPSEDTERRIELRLMRQTLLTQPGAPQLWAVVDEAALRRPVGGRQVIREQLERLIDATKLPNVILQMLPLDADAHPTLVSAFSILRFPDQELPNVVYVEHLTSALYLDRREDVDQYLHVMETICVRSTAPRKTTEILDGILRAE